MDFGLKGKTALISGSYRGTGNAIIKCLKDEGANVILHAFNQKDAEASASELGVEHFVFADITSGDEYLTIRDQLTDLDLSVDILINNYGGISGGRWGTFSAQDWLDIYNKNVLSAVRLIELFTPHMKQKKFGRIIQLSTIGAKKPNKIMPHYYASKAALTNTTLSLARELTGTGITVNTVSPGLIKTAELEAMYTIKAKKKGWGSSWEEIETNIVKNEFPNFCGRIAKVEEVASLVAYLCSTQASFISGQDINIDGGACNM